jgi:hypothetical protein
VGVLRRGDHDDDEVTEESTNEASCRATEVPWGDVLRRKEQELFRLARCKGMG